MKRFLVVLALLVASTPALAQQPQFPSQNVTLPTFVIPASAVNGGGTVTAPQLLAPDGSASAPSYSFAAHTGDGMWYLNGLQWSQAGNAAMRLVFDSVNGLILHQDIPLTWGSSGVNTPATKVYREADGHLFQRNSTNAQRASWAIRYGGAADYESVSIDAGQTTANTGIIGCRTAASGTGRPCRFASQASSAGTISYLEIAANGNATLTGAFTSYNGVAAAGQGVEVIRAQATTGTVTNSGTASIATWTPGAADVEVEVSCRVNITVSTTHSFSCDVTYTDVANNARTRVLEMFPITGTPLTSGLMTNTVGAGDFASAVTRIGVKASTAITVRTSSGGTFTTVTYTASGTIKQVG